MAYDMVFSLFNTPKANQNPLFERYNPSNVKALSLSSRVVFGWISPKQAGLFSSASIPDPYLHLPASAFQKLQDGFRHSLRLGDRHTCQRALSGPFVFVWRERNFLTKPCFLARCSHSRKASGSSGTSAPAALSAS